MLGVIVALILTMLVPAGAFAAAPPQAGGLKRLSIGDAIGIALRKNRKLTAAELSSDAALSQVTVVRAAMLPHLDASENFSDTNGPWAIINRLAQQEFSSSDFALDNLNHPSFLSNFQSQVSISFPLFAGGRLLAAYRAAGSEADAERWRMIATRQRVEYATIRSYYAAALAEQRVTVVERALTAARGHLELARNLFEHGMAVDADVLRTKVMVGTLEQQQIEAASAVDISRAALAHTLGEEDQRLAPLKNAAEAATGVAAPQSLEALTKLALSNRPELKVARAQVEQAREQVKIARAGYLPRIGFSAAYENDSENLTRAGNNGGFFLTARVPLFDGFATGARVEAADAGLSRAQVLARDLRHAVALEVESAQRTLVAASQALRVARRDTRYAKSALRILEDRYRSGLATNVAVLDAQSASEQTDMRLAQAAVAVAVDAAALDLATGTEPESAVGR